MNLGDDYCSLPVIRDVAVRRSARNESFASGWWPINFLRHEYVEPFEQQSIDSEVIL